MARLPYGFGTADIVAVVTSDDGDYGPPSNAVVFDVYDAQTGGTAVTDLALDEAGTQPITQVSSDVATGRIGFYGPDGTTGPLWLEDSADPGSARYLVNPADLATRESATGSVTSVAGRTGDVTLSTDDLTDATTTGKALATAADAAAARTTLQVTRTADLATIATSGAISDATGELNDAQLFPGTILRIVYDDGTSTWPTLPSSRLDVYYDFLGATEADPPPGMKAGDTWDRPA